ncbi:MAG: DUF5011 domain-containing protein [Cytophagaceae bacterium]|nr:DUF5011 domain-containing protein [Cytophagaceae bacterium]
MKVYKYILGLSLSLLLFASCEKESEGVSRLTTYATLEMEGANLMLIQINSAYTEPGVSAFEGETEVPVVITGTVDTATKGVYVIQYSAKNSDGFSASTTRMVAVVAKMPTTDLSGEYELVHATRTGTSTIGINDGILGYYHATESWWQAYPIPLDFVDMGDGTIIVLQGSSPYGAHYGTGEILDDGQIKFTVTLANQGPLTYSTTYKLKPLL